MTKMRNFDFENGSTGKLFFSFSFSLRFCPVVHRLR
jgi:hypothetical protein